ncbi:MAG: hypothetical protein WCZ99_01220 [Candidatus Paceibacterota bacterium]
MKHILTISIFLFFFFPAFVFGISGTISSSANVVKVGENFTITVKGYNDMGITWLGVYGGNDKQTVDVKGKPSEASKSWIFQKNTPGTYKYCGSVAGCTVPSASCVSRPMPGTFNTNPQCIEVEVSSASSNDLTVSCYSSPSTVKVNETVNFISSVSGASGSYSYSWSGNCSGTSNSCSKSFSSTGNYSVTLSVQSENQSKTATCFVNVIDNGSTSASAKGTLNVSPLSVFVNDIITITVEGEDNGGLVSVGAHFKGFWNVKNVSGTNAKEVWQIEESVPGTYKYCAFVKGKSQSGSVETSPYCMDVVVLSKKKAPVVVNECSFIGESRCYGAGYVTKCTSQNGVLKWSTPVSCTGDTSYGYGTCNSDEKPAWYCDNGTCKYNCIYDEDKNEDSCQIIDENPLSISILARKDKEGDFKQELEVENENKIDFLAVVKNISDQQIDDVSIVISPQKGVNFSNYKEEIKIILGGQKSETFLFYGEITNSEEEEFIVEAKVQGGDFKDFSEVKLIRKNNGFSLAAIGPAMSGLFKKWYFWLIFLIIMFLLFYFFRRKRQV